MRSARAPRLNDVELIEGLRDHDPAAAKHLHDCFVPSIWRFVYFRVDQNPHIAEDIVADSVLALVDAVAAGMLIRRPLPWLRKVAVRRIQDHFRAVARVQKLISQAEQQAGDGGVADPADQHDQKLQQQAVRDAMAQLPDVYQLGLELKYLDHLSVKEMAKRMSTTEKAVESILFRARGALRKQLKQQGIVSSMPSLPDRSNATEAVTNDARPMMFSSRLAGGN